MNTGCKAKEETAVGTGTGAILRAVGLGLLFWLGGRFLLPLCFPFLLGTGLALAAEPAVRLLSGRLRLPRPLGAAIAVTAVSAGMTLLVLLVLAFLVRELGLLAGILPDLTQTAQSGITLLRSWLLDMAGRTPQSIRPLLQQNVTGFFSGGTALLDKGFSYILGLAGAILSRMPDSALTLGTGLISGVMISAKLPRIRRWIHTRFPRERLRPLLDTLKRMKTAVGGWLLAQLRLAGVTLVLLVLGLVVLGIPYAPLWAVGIALVDAVPVLGTGTVLLPWALISYLQADRARAIGLLALYVVISVTRSVLEPKLLGKHLGLDPLVTLFALYAGYRVWGFWGMVAAPLLAVTAVQLLPGQRK